MNQDVSEQQHPSASPLLAAFAQWPHVLSAGKATLRFGLPLCAALSIAGCGLAAAPCRVSSAALKVVPVVGHTAATPTDACADVIDP
jgi:hypothetical protein